MMKSISVLVNSNIIGIFAKVFISICAITSFLGVALSLTDFIADGLQTEKKGIEGGSEKGDLFSFDINANKTELTISNLKGTRMSDEASKFVEGVYAREKK